MATCINCNNQISRKGKYCDNKCQNDYQYTRYIADWKLGIASGVKYVGEVSNYVRRYLHEQAGAKCIKCGWGEVHSITRLVPLTVNHIDGDAENNRPENLELLCPNCHSLTPNYGSLNKGNSKRRR